jgi:hypothetical protein
MIDLEKIQEMWEKDSKIDIDNLHTESLNIPVLHSKYYNLYNTISLLQEKTKYTYNQIKLEQYNYYTGKSPAEVYVEHPFPYKVREKDAIQRYIDADEKVSKAFMKVKYYELMLKFLEEIIKAITNRNFHIKNSIDFMKFSAGLS